MDGIGKFDISNTTSNGLDASHHTIVRNFRAVGAIPQRNAYGSSAAGHFDQARTVPTSSEPKPSDPTTIVER
jgi:hypothetical protein